MKKFLCLFILGILSLAAYSQDLIVKKDGSVIQAKVAEIGTSEVKYKKWTNQDGPTYSIAIADILAINYPDGSKEDFSNTSVASQEATSHEVGVPQLVTVPTADNNAQLIADYNKICAFTKKVKAKNKKAPYAIGQYVFDESSVLSNDELEVSFAVSDAKNPLWVFRDQKMLCYYCIVLKNKTDRIMYVDLGNCFRINEKANDSYCYYNLEQTNITKGKSQGASFNLGGVTSALGVGGVVGSLAGATSVGGSRGSSVQKQYGQQQIITIPPHGIRKLSDYEYVQTGVRALELVSKGECFSAGLYLTKLFGHSREDVKPPLKSGLVKIGEIRHFSLDESPIVYNYTITYSLSPDFINYSQVNSTLYLGYLYGHSYKKGKYNIHLSWMDSNEGCARYYIDDSNPQIICGPVVLK